MNTIRCRTAKQVRNAAERLGDQTYFDHATIISAKGANLACGALAGLDLGHANMYEVNLINADLRNTRLFGADLRFADLNGANFIGAFLKNAKLHGAYVQYTIGLLRLPVGDPRGFDAVAVWHGDEWMIAAGCRWLTVRDALRHWGRYYGGYPSVAKRYRRALDWLEEQPTPADDA